MPNTSISFPLSPTQGQQYTYGSTTYIYDGTSWSVDSTLLASPLKLDSTNNRVGINNNAPTVALDVTGAIKGSTTLEITGATTLSNTLNVSNNLTVDTNTFFVDSTNNRVGIGTASPSACLQIASSTGVIFGSTVGSNGTSTITTALPASPVSSRFAFGTDNTGWQYRIAKNNAGTITDLVTVQDNGNVGIGTTTPAAALDVNGVMYGKIPCFYATRTSTTAQTTAGTIIFNTEEVDNTSNYDPTTGVFTAPITGIYEFDFSILSNIITTTAGSVASFAFFKNESTRVSVQHYTIHNAAVTVNLQYVQVAGSVIVSLNATDTIRVKLVTAAGGAGVLGASNGPVPHSSFSGKLIARS